MIARGILLGRPITAGHAVAAAVLAATGLTTHLLSFELPGAGLSRAPAPSRPGRWRHGGTPLRWREYGR